MIAYSMLMIIKVSDLIDINFESKVSNVKVKYTQNHSYGSHWDFIYIYDGGSFFCTMIGYGVLTVTYVLDRQFCLRIKGQCQIIHTFRLNY